MKDKIRTTIGIGTAVIALALASTTLAQVTNTPLTAEQLAERRAAARQRSEEATRYLNEMMANMQTEAAARAAARPPVDPAVAKQRAEQATRKREADWQARLEAARPFLRSWGWPGDAETLETREAARTELQELARKAAEAKADAPRIEAELEAISILLNTPRERVREDGSKEILGGQIDGQPVYYSSQNLIAGASISADELWPTNSAPWAHASTGRNLTGTNVTLGLWEVDGAVLTNHLEFGTRARQVDYSATNQIPSHWHATGVAGTMAAGGAITFTLGGQPARLLRGAAFEARLNAYRLDVNFATRRLEAAAGTVTGEPLRLANHSWGYAGGWIQQTIQVRQGNQTNTIPNAWIWRGHPALAEEWKFGFYWGDPGDGTGCTNIDRFLANDAPRHLMVYAAGNDRLTGPGAATTYYYYVGPGPYDWQGVTNPPAGSRDWRNGDGDTGAYDTMLAPGTAKNVLTVGAVRDVYRVVGSDVQYGYATNASVVLAPFSGCGPTDDGRIKPDIAAVGQADPTLRAFGILTPIDGTTSNYYSLAGTSFAAPGVSGGLGLAMQRRNQLWPNLDPDLDAWRGSTWRTLAIHTADDVGAPGPDYQLGYGLFNAASCVAQVERDQQHGRGTHIKEFQIGVSNSVSWEVDLTNGVPFRATLGWSDPAGLGQLNIEVDNSTPRLVNNLNLRLERVGATNVYYPWLLNPDLTNKTEAARGAAATTGVDNRNNVEQVFIANPATGRYRVVVTHSGGLTGGLSSSAQWATLQTSGDTPLAPVFTAIEPSPTGTNMLLTFTADPGAYFHLLTSTNLVTWQTNATVKAEGVTNSILAQVTDPYRFWRLRRQQ